MEMSHHPAQYKFHIYTTTIFSVTFSYWRHIDTHKDTNKMMMMMTVILMTIIWVQSNLGYPDFDYPDFSIILTFFSGPTFVMNILWVMIKIHIHIHFKTTAFKSE